MFMIGMSRTALLGEVNFTPEKGIASMSKDLKKLGRVAAMVTASALASAALAQPGSGDPDVIVGDLIGYSNYGTNSAGTPNDNWIYAYAIGTTSCNVAPVNNSVNDLLWVASTNRHPVIGQNVYRLSVVNGATRLEMIGQGWLKHGFTALTQSLCNTCSGRGGSVLGVGCSDPYSSSLNGSQSNLGPRNHVNVTTGFFPYPFTNPGAGYSAPPAATAVIGRRVQIKRVDINPAQNPNSLYFSESQYVAQDDSAERTKSRGNYAASTNNASYRRATVTNNAQFSLSNADTTRRTSPGIFAWRDYGGRAANGNFNMTVDNEVELVSLDFEGDGRYWVAGRVTDLGNGTWRYEYAVENLTSSRAGGGFKVPVPAGVSISNIGFHDVDYHSGEPFDNTDWASSVGGGFVTWSSPQTYAQNPNSNALRWSTMYNFFFDANTAPVAEDVELILFKPGAPGSMFATVKAPGELPPPPCPPCIADYNESGGTPDDADVAEFFAAWNNGEPCADANGSGGTPDDADVTEFFTLWNNGGC